MSRQGREARGIGNSENTIIQQPVPEVGISGKVPLAESNPRRRNALRRATPCKLSNLETDA